MRCKNCGNEHAGYRFPHFRRQRERLDYSFPANTCAMCLVKAGWELHDVRSTPAKPMRWVPRGSENADDKNDTRRGPLRESAPREQLLSDIKRAMELLENATNTISQMPS